MELKVYINKVHNQGDLNSAKMYFGPYLEILTSTGGEWTHGQAHNGINFDFKLNLTLYVKVNCSLKQ